MHTSYLLGMVLSKADEGVAPRVLARAIEERGFDSLFIAEHTHIPLNRKSPWPRGGELAVEVALEPIHGPVVEKLGVADYLGDVSSFVRTTPGPEPRSRRLLPNASPSGDRAGHRRCR